MEWQNDKVYFTDIAVKSGKVKFKITMLYTKMYLLLTLFRPAFIVLLPPQSVLGDPLGKLKTAHAQAEATKTT